MVLRLHGYGVWVESNDKPLEESAIEVKGNVISCYICSEEGQVSCTCPLCNLASLLTRRIHQQFSLHFDDDGSHSNQLPVANQGQVIVIKMDGTEVDRVWNPSMAKIASHGMRSGDIIHPYIFAPIDTTGSSPVFSSDPTNLPRPNIRR